MAVPAREWLAAGATALALLGIAGGQIVRPLGGAVLRSTGLRAGEVFPVQRHGRTLVVSSREEAADLRALLEAVDRRAWPGARLFVGPRDLRRTLANDTFLYFLLPDLEPATYFLIMNPGTANRPGSRRPATSGRRTS